MVAQDLFSGCSNFLLPTLIASISGMNCEHMPQEVAPGLSICLGTHDSFSYFAYWYFKRRKWL